VLRNTGANEVHLDNIAVSHGSVAGYLQTSPEYAMKHLLAEYGVSLFQICPAFRGGETGQRHKVEFQMLEWYRCEFTAGQLMDDLEALLQSLFKTVMDGRNPGSDLLQSAARVSYATLFESRYAINPHAVSTEELQRLAGINQLAHLGENPTRSDCLDALFSTGIEPALQKPHIVYDYPSCQSALAELVTSTDGHEVSNRFEYFVSGMEIANAYQELTNGQELAQRFQENNALRIQLGKPEIPPDTTLISAIDRMPRCAGIALGVDRLAMILLGTNRIDDVML
jgi:lysyl-tRNA synthetase class 2